jgi:muramoyltetrapeptide carboxypeptidase
MRRIAICLLIALTLFPARLHAQDLPPIRPPALRPGDTVAVVAPAGPVDRYRVTLARKRLKALGLNLRVPPGLYRRRGYLAGDDQARADEFMAAFRDPTVKAVLPGVGGYGATRMLDLLDYDVIRANPKILVGFSDITALHLAIQRKTGLITFHGPLLTYGLGSPSNLTDFSAEYFRRVLFYKSYFDWANDPLDEGYTYHIPSDVATLRTIATGQARGRLTGGNLSLVCALMGTPYEIQTDHRILFLEDVNEEPYRIDRLLSQLRLAGKFDHVAGVVLGIFTGCDSRKGDNGLSLSEVLDDYFADLPVPVVVGFPAGHTRQNATLPLNALVELDAAGPRLRVLDNPVQINELSSHPTQPTQPETTEEPGETTPDSQSDSPPPESQPATPGLPSDEFEAVPQKPSKPIDPEILRRIP